MAITLPNINARRRAPQSRDGIVSDPTAGLVADTVSGVAGDAQRVANQIQQQQDDLSYAQAKADMVIADVDARSALKDDTDHKTHVERYAKPMGEALTKATSRIGNQRDRARFELENKLFMARNHELVNNRVRSLARDERRATTATTIEALRDSALTDTAEGADFLAAKTAGDLIDKGVAAGDYGFDEGRQIKDKLSESWAVAKIEMMGLPEQIVALQSEKGGANQIDPDVRAHMLETAIKATATEVTKGLSQAAADEIYETGEPLKDQLIRARDIEDASIRDATVKRLKERDREDKVVAEGERVSNLEKVYGVVDSPDTNFDDIPSDLWAQLPAKDRHAVEKYVKPGKILTNYSAWGALNRMKQNDPQAFAKVSLVDYMSIIDTSDLQAFSDDQNKILDAGPEFDGYQLQTDKQAVDGAAREIGIDTKPSANKGNIELAGKWNWRFDQNVNLFKRQNNGREPNSKERKEILDQMSVEVVTERNAFLYFDLKDRAFEISDIEGVPDDQIDRLVSLLRDNDLAATPDNIQEAWRRDQNGR